jgi:hypothetical protein
LELKGGQAVISEKLMHQVAGRAQNILGYVELAEIEPDEKRRKEWFNRARDEIRDLTAMLQANVARGRKVDE